jgi:hypothetical protein
MSAIVQELRPLLRCRIFGHRWKPSHREDFSKQGLAIWVYIGDVCTRCWRSEWRMPESRSQSDGGAES